MKQPQKCNQETLLKSYSIHLEALKEREENFLKFLGIVVPALGGILYLFRFKESETILAGLIIITAFLFWALLYSISSSYTYRYLQISLWNLEENLYLPHSTQWDPMRRLQESCKFQRGFKWDIFPENQKMHAIGIYLLIIVSWTGWAIIASKENTANIIFIAGIILYCVISLICSYYENKYEKNYKPEATEKKGRKEKEKIRREV